SDRTPNPCLIRHGMISDTQSSRKARPSSMGRAGTSPRAWYSRTRCMMPRPCRRTSWLPISAVMMTRKIVHSAPMTLPTWIKSQSSISGMAMNSSNRRPAMAGKYREMQVRSWWRRVPVSSAGRKFCQNLAKRLSASGRQGGNTRALRSQLRMLAFGALRLRTSAGDDLGRRLVDEIRIGQARARAADLLVQPGQLLVQTGQLRSLINQACHRHQQLHVADQGGGRNRGFIGIDVSD